MSKFYILEEHELFDPNDMSEFAVEFDGNLRGFVKNKITRTSSCWIPVKNTGCLIPIYECRECNGTITGLKPPYCLWCGRKMINKYEEDE